MNTDIQLTGVNELLEFIYGNGVHLDDLLLEIGFERSHVTLLQDRVLSEVVNDFLQVVHERLTSEGGRDTYYQILSRRFGLDGNPPESLEAIASQHGFTIVYMNQLFEEILDRCRSKSAQEEFKKSLKHIGIAHLRKMQVVPNREKVVEKLARLTNLRAAADVARLDYEAKRKTLLKDIQSELDALEAEYAPVLEAADENIGNLENEIRTGVLLHGESVDGGAYRAVFTRGRVSWDSRGIESYAASHPEVLRFRKQGAPSVSLRLVKDS